MDETIHKLEIDRAEIKLLINIQSELVRRFSEYLEYYKDLMISNGFSAEVGDPDYDTCVMYASRATFNSILTSVGTEIDLGIAIMESITDKVRH